MLREPISGADGRPWFSGRADGIATLDRGPFAVPWFIPRSPEKPPALGGRGTFREAMGRLSGIRLEVETKVDGTIQRKLVQVLGSDTAKVD